MPGCSLSCGKVSKARPGLREAFTLQLTWEKDYSLRVYEVGFDGHVSLPNLMNFLQDAAIEHAAHLGAGFSQLAPRNLAWFVTRYHVRVTRYPVYGETIRVKTWPKAKKRLFAIRGFEMYSGNEPIAAGSTAWCLVDLASKSPLNVNTALPNLPENPRDALATVFPRIPLPQSPSHAETFSPGISEIDMNGHVNNTALINRAMECLPHTRFKDHTISEMVTFFKHEIGLGQSILSQASIEHIGNPLESLHCLAIKGSETEVLRMKLIWEKRKLR